jgi:(p)ppGpp synthase/HD superfamily hydrolase
MINEAIIFATNAHGNQTRKGSDTLYILHPLEAGIIVSQIKYDENLIAAAILHDTVEDTKVSIETIEEKFGKRVSELVEVESEDKSKTWKERKQHTIEHLKAEKDQDIKIVTLGDKLSNIRAMNRDYLKIGDELWKRFNEKNKNEHKWYYEGMVEALESLSQYQAYQEFKELVSIVFNDK